jgi:hypothetical protein
MSLNFWHAEQNGEPAAVDSAAAARAPPNYLADELTRRRAKEPVKLRVLVQLPNPGDGTKDASAVYALSVQHRANVTASKPSTKKE